MSKVFALMPTIRDVSKAALFDAEAMAFNTAIGVLNAACVTERGVRAMVRKVVPVGTAVGTAVACTATSVATYAINVVVPTLEVAYNASRSDVAQRDEAVELMSIGVSRVVGVQVADDDDIDSDDDCVLVATQMWDMINNCLYDPTASQDLSKPMWLVPAVWNPESNKYVRPGSAALASAKGPALVD
jgi:hypothetical protein